MPFFYPKESTSEPPGAGKARAAEPPGAGKARAAERLVGNGEGISTGGNKQVGAPRMAEFLESMERKGIKTNNLAARLAPGILIIWEPKQ